MKFTSLLSRQIAFSRATFGPNERTNGVLDHIEKESQEIRDSHDALARSIEWVDIHMLACDGHWRAVAAAYPDATTDHIAKIVEQQLTAKLGENELRDWPDWRTADPDKAIEHDRSGELAFEVAVTVKISEDMYNSESSNLVVTMFFTGKEVVVNSSKVFLKPKAGKGIWRLDTTRAYALEVGLITE